MLVSSTFPVSDFLIVSNMLSFYLYFWRSMWLLVVKELQKLYCSKQSVEHWHPKLVETCTFCTVCMLLLCLLFIVIMIAELIEKFQNCMKVFMAKKLADRGTVCLEHKYCEGTGNPGSYCNKNHVNMSRNNMAGCPVRVCDSTPLCGIAEESSHTWL